MNNQEPTDHRPAPLAWRSRMRRQNAFVRYGMVVVYIGVAFVIRLSLTPLIVDYDPFMFFAPAALIATWLGGIGPGIAAWAGGILVGDFFFTGPLYTFGPYGAVQITLMATYSVETAIGIFLIEALDRMRHRAQGSAEEATQRGKRLEREMVERKKAEEALRLREEQLRLITDSLPVLISYIDKEERYQFLNQQYQLWFDRAPREAFGQHVRDVWGDTAYETMREPIAAAFQGRQVTYERWVENAKGTRCNQIIYVPDRDQAGTVRGLFVLVNDVTEQKRAEEALQKAQAQLAEHAADLELRVAERTTKLKQSLEDMEKLLYSVAHNFRGPLRAMEGFSTLLLKQYAPHLEAVGQDYARRIGQAATHLDRLILDLLAYGRLSHVPLTSSQIGLQLAIDTAQTRLAEQIKATGAELQIQEPLPTVWANLSLLQESLTHLLSNALKFSSPGIKPRIAIRAEDLGTKVRLWVSDNGIGIAPEHRQKIFKLFERLHGGNIYPGTGVGLALVAKAMERMEGRAGVDSKPGEGSAFWIELPKQPAACPQPVHSLL